MVIVSIHSGCERAKCAFRNILEKWFDVHLEGLYDLYVGSRKIMEEFVQPVKFSWVDMHALIECLVMRPIVDVSRQMNEDACRKHSKQTPFGVSRADSWPAHHDCILPLYRQFEKQFDSLNEVAFDRMITMLHHLQLITTRCKDLPNISKLPFIFEGRFDFVDTNRPRADLCAWH